MLNSLDSFTPLKRGTSSLGRAANNEPSKSSGRDIFRYSYNLGIQRTKQLQRAASLSANIGGGITQINHENDSFAKEIVRRRTLPRSMSMESGPVFDLHKMSSDTLHEVVSASPNNVLGTQAAAMEISRRNGKTNSLDVKLDTTKESQSDPVEDTGHETTSTAGDHDSQKNETTTHGGEARTKSSENSRPKSASLSESVPDLRILANVDKTKTNCEDFPTFLPPDSGEKAQSRPICKLRRAARRLGVSLSSEELYHKQRRNGLCTEIDDAADNRKLLRVLNKRF